MKPTPVRIAINNVYEISVTVGDTIAGSCSGTLRHSEPWATSAVERAVRDWETIRPANRAQMDALHGSVGRALAVLLRNSDAIDPPWKPIEHLLSRGEQARVFFDFLPESYDRWAWELLGGFELAGSAEPWSIRSDMTFTRLSRVKKPPLAPALPTHAHVVSGSVYFGGDAARALTALKRVVEDRDDVKVSSRGSLGLPPGAPVSLLMYLGHGDGDDFQFGGGNLSVEDLVQALGAAQLYSILACNNQDQSCVRSAVFSTGPGFESLASACGRPVVATQAHFALSSAAELSRHLNRELFRVTPVDQAVQTARRLLREYDVSQIAFRNAQGWPACGYYWRQLIIASPSVGALDAIPDFSQRPPLAQPSRALAPEVKTLLARVVERDVSVIEPLRDTLNAFRTSEREGGGCGSLDVWDMERVLLRIDEDGGTQIRELPAFTAFVALT